MALTRRSLLAAMPSAAWAHIADGAPPLIVNSTLPNIVWILAEDMGPQLGCYGEPLVKTPNLDRLAAEGARFTHAFTTAPVCSSSRSAMATGMYQTSIGAQQHRTFAKKPLAAPVRHINEYLRQAGYFSVLCAPPKTGKRSLGEGSGAWGSGKTDYNFSIDRAFDGSDWAERRPGQPFFAQLSIEESHKGYGWPLARKQTPRIDPARIRLPAYCPDHAIARDEHANYLESVQLVDRYVGEVLARLEREGLRDNTLVIFSGDNGQCLFRSKQFLYDGGIHVPLIVRWPGQIAASSVRPDFVEGIDVSAAVLGAAGMALPAHMQGRNFLASNAKPRSHIFAARDRCGIANDRMRCVRDRDFKYIKNWLPSIPYMQANPYKEGEYPTWNLVKRLAAEGKLSKEQRHFAAASKPVEELYDLAADPDEVCNLADDPAQRGRLLAMCKLVDDWVVNTGDQGTVMEDPVVYHQR
jgi:N-sulfoglucosamine sulfohydrolase